MPEPDSDIRENLDELSHRSNENFVSIEKSLNKINERLDIMSNEVQMLGSHGKGVPFDAELLENVVNRIDSVEASLSAIKTDVESGAPVAMHVKAGKDILPSSLSQLREIQEDMRELKKFQTKSRLNFFEVEKRLVKVESGETHTEHTKTHTAPALEKKIASMEEKLGERIKSLEDIMMLLEVELVKAKGSTSLIEIPSRYEDRLKALEQKLQEIENARFRMPAESIAQEPRIRNLEENIASLESRMNRRMQEAENRILSAMAGPGMSEEAAGTMLAKLSEEMGDMRHEIEKAKMLKDQLARLETGTAKKDHVDRIRGDVAQQVSILKEQVERIISSGKSLGALAVDAESDLKKQFEDYKRFLDTRIIDMEDKLHSIVREEAKRIMLTEEAKNIVERLEKIEKEVEQRAYAVVVREFETFAEAIDKRFPELVTRQDLRQELRDLRFPAVQAPPPKPDVTPVMDRLDTLEERLKELGEALYQSPGTAIVIE